MKVNGKAFKQAREQIRKDHADELPLRGEPAIGTQEWLASKASYTVTRNKKAETVSPTVRTIQNLENKGVASLPIIKAVSIPLRINGYEFILDYGKDSVHQEALGVVDFRPTNDMLVDPENYFKSTFLITIDPLLISFEDEDLDAITLKNLSAELQLGEFILGFSSLYEVSLIPGNPWLGVEKEAEMVEFKSPFSYKKSVMFKQNESSLAWEDFIKMIDNTDQKKMKITVKSDFEYFYKELKILLSIEEMRGLMEKAAVKYKALYTEHNLKWPRFMQPNALTLD